MTTFLLKNDKRLHISFGRRSSFFYYESTNYQ